MESRPPSEEGFTQADREAVEAAFAQAERDAQGDVQAPDEERAWWLALRGQMRKLGLQAEAMPNQTVGVRLSLHGAPMLLVPAEALEELRVLGAHPLAVGHLLAACAIDDRFAWWDEEDDEDDA